MTTSSNQIEDFRQQLKTQQIAEFFDSISNQENQDAEIESLTAVASKVISRLVDIQQAKIKELISGDEVCPGCVIASTIDLTSIKAMGEAFNKFVTTPSCSTEEGP